MRVCGAFFMIQSAALVRMKIMQALPLVSLTWQRQELPVVLMRGLSASGWLVGNGNTGEIVGVAVELLVPVAALIAAEVALAAAALAAAELVLPVPLLVPMVAASASGVSKHSNTVVNKVDGDVFFMAFLA